MAQTRGGNLVTGGAGFLGHHLVAALRERDEPVRVLDPAAPLRDAPGVEHVAGSVTDPEALASALVGVGRVFHLAARAELWLPDKRDYERVNHLGTRTVLAAAAEAGVDTVVHCSTEAVLTPATADGAVVDEDARPPLAAMPGPYCRAKLLAEQAAFAAAGAGQRVIVVSPTVPLGPADRNLTPPARMLLGFLNGDYPAYLETTLNLVDARDVAAAHVLAAERGVAGRRYVLGGTDIALSDLLAGLGALTGLAMPRRRVPYGLAWLAAQVGERVADHVTHRPPAAPLTGVRLARRRVRFDNTRARTELGAAFRPLAETLHDTVRDLHARGLLTRTPALDP